MDECGAMKRYRHEERVRIPIRLKKDEGLKFAVKEKRAESEFRLS